VRVLFLTKYTAAGPSSRYRVVQFLPFLQARGIEWDLHALHDDGYLASRYAGRRVSPLYLAGRVASRLAALAGSRRYDLVFIQKEMFPHLIDLPEWILARTGIRYVVDLDDAIHLMYEGARGWRRALRHKLPRVLAGASLVLAGNRYLESYARRFTSRVVLFPTVVDTRRFSPAPARSGADASVVGWIGTPETAPYLQALLPALAAVARETPVTLFVIGADAPSLSGVPTRAKAWSESEEVDDLHAMDIGVMPLADDEWSKGKCALKLLQYMGAGIPAVTSPCGSAPDIVVDGESGYFARTDDEWRERIALLATSEARRRTIAARARQVVETRYSLDVWGPRFAGALAAAVEGTLPDTDTPGVTRHA